MTQSDLQKLSEEATEGEWRACEEDDEWAIRQVNDDPPGVTTVIAEGLHQGYDYGRADAAFIVALVNAFREGRLVEASL